MDNFIWKIASDVVMTFPVFITLAFLMNYIRQFWFNN